MDRATVDMQLQVGESSSDNRFIFSESSLPGRVERHVIRPYDAGGVEQILFSEMGWVDGTTCKARQFVFRNNTGSSMIVSMTQGPGVQFSATIQDGEIVAFCASESIETDSMANISIFGFTSAGTIDLVVTVEE